MYNIQIIVTDEYGNVEIYSPEQYVYLSCILNPHYDSSGNLDGGTVIKNGQYFSHVDPSGERGAPGEPGILLTE